MSTRIDIAALTSGLESAVSKLRQEIDAAKNAARDGIEVTLDTSAAEAGLSDLLNAIQDAKDALESPSTIHVDTDSATRAVVEIAQVSQDAEKALSLLDGKKVGVDTGPAKQALDALRDSADKAFPQAGGATRSGKEAEDAKRLAEQLDRIRKTKEVLERLTGRQVTDWQAERADEVLRGRGERNSLLRGFDGLADWHAKVGDRFSTKAEADDHRRRFMADIESEVFGSPGKPSAWRGMASRYAGVAGGIAGGMITGGGGMWGSLGAAAGGALGAIPGLGMILGPLAGSVLGAFGGRIDQGTQDATSTALDISRLKHSLGDVNDSFDTLRIRVQSAADGLGIAYVEAARYAKNYSELANLTREQRAALGGELRAALGFSRGFGLDPQSGVNFFGQMRLTGQVSDEKSAKTMAVHVAEAVERGGNRAKMDEVLTAISGFSTHAARVSLTRPDALSFASLMATGTATRIPGLDPAGAAGLLSTADQALRGGGGYGDASKIAIMSAISGGNSKLSVFDVEAIMEGGLFGTAGKTFGRGGIMRERAQRLGLSGELSRYDQIVAGDSGATNIAKLIPALRGQSSTDDEYLAQLRGALGLQSIGQAAAIDMMHATDPGLGSLRKKLASAGVDFNKLTGSSLGGIAEVAQGDIGVLNQYAGKLRQGVEYKALSDKERERLDGAGNQEELRSVLLALMSDRERQENIGDKALNVQTDMRNTFQRLAEELLPATVTIKDGVLALVERFAPGSRLRDRENKEINEQVAAKTREKVASDKAAGLAAHDANRMKLEDAYSRGAVNKTGYDAAVASMDAERQRRYGAGPWMPASGSKSGAQGSGRNLPESDLDQIFQRHGAEKGVPWRAMKELARHESGLKNVRSKPNRNGSVDEGYMQLNSRYHDSRRVTDPYDPDQNIGAGTEYFASLLKRHGGDVRKALKSYNGTGPEADRYADTVIRKWQSAGVIGQDEKFVDRIPEEGRRMEALHGTVTGSASININVDGKTVRETMPLKGSWSHGGAVPAGAG